MSDNTYIIQVTGTNSGLLSAYPVVSYSDGYYIRPFSDDTTFNYPTTTFGGALTAGILPVPLPTNWDGGVSFLYNISGGPLRSYSYDDFSRLTSKIFIGNYFCEPTLILSFSSYDESRSFVKRISYRYDNDFYTITPQITTYETFFTVLTTTNIIKVHQLLSPKNRIGILNPKPDISYLKPKTIFLEIIKADDTVNKFELNFNMLQCGLFDVYKEANILNSQMLDSSEKILLTLEDKKTKQIYSTILDVDTPFYLLTGGDIQLPAPDVEVEIVFDLEAQEGIAPVQFLAEQIQQQTLQLPTIPLPTPIINPVNPQLGEYYYRGEKGIRIRPLLVKLLPGQEFYYEIPTSGMILTSGGAPYYPGRGILYNLEFRVI